MVPKGGGRKRTICVLERIQRRMKDDLLRTFLTFATFHFPSTVDIFTEYNFITKLTAHHLEQKY